MADAHVKVLCFKQNQEILRIPYLLLLQIFLLQTQPIHNHECITVSVFCHNLLMNLFPSLNFSSSLYCFSSARPSLVSIIYREEEILFCLFISINSNFFHYMQEIMTCLYFALFFTISMSVVLLVIQESGLLFVSHMQLV